MNYLALRPILWTNQLNETVQFYTNILGFTCHEKNDDWGMREFAIYDNNGYLLQFGQEV